MNILITIYIASGLLLSLLAIPMNFGWVPPNRLYGFRVPETLDNHEIWFDVNRFAGRHLLIVGLLTIAVAVVFSRIPSISVDAYAWACLGVIGTGLLVTLIQSFRYLKVRLS